jgi:protocatechuate 3,4-dioxygenase beta subunit
MTSQIERDAAAIRIAAGGHPGVDPLDRRQVLAGMAGGLSMMTLAACGAPAGAQGGAGAGERQAGRPACLATPREIKGPFPADGSNGRPRPINVLDLEGIERRDIRASFGGLSGQAEGVPLQLELELRRGGGACTPLPGHAVYLWQNDAAGAYSLYNLREANYLRGLQGAGSAGRLTFTTIVPGCYGGRFPHCHFEVFESVAAATAGAEPLLVSQLAFPALECGAIYRADERYGDSLTNLERLPIERDFVFGDSDAAGRERQSVAMQGNPTSGYRGQAIVVLT